MKIFLDFLLAALCIGASCCFIAFLVYETYMMTKDVQEYREFMRRVLNDTPESDVDKDAKPKNEEKENE